MIPTRTFAARQAGLALLALLLASALSTGAAKSQTSTAAIDTECNAIQNAVMALHPVHVVLKASKWVVVSDADYAIAEKTTTSITFADAYKQGKNYAWIAAHTFDASGKQRATQLCFRQSDGTLERARQATEVPKLSAASAEQAYYSSSGKIIQKTQLFEVNDPLIALKIAELPFFNVLP